MKLRDLPSAYKWRKLKELGLDEEMKEIKEIKSSNGKIEGKISEIFATHFADEVSMFELPFLNLHLIELSVSIFR